MRTSWFLNLVFLFLPVQFVVVSGDLRFAPRRPDESPSPTVLPTGAAPSSAASTTTSGHEVSPSDEPSSSSSPDSTNSAAPSSTTHISQTTLTAIPSATPTLSSNATSAPNINDGSLPLPPTITPALSLAGAFLILSGVVYNLIGIKNKAIQIFISTAYLIALATTVLLVYIINPPISDAIQGAYFIAAFLPAVGLGGISLIFQDVTEGLGSAAGGFALSMWFLVLKPGGTLTNTVSKAVFIGCWTAGIYTIYFSRHIRSYVIIGATSFAGATAVILGIDCFSLAGLKEFWVYIWGLNGKLFPPGQSTYPITRGMTVEIAGIVIFTLFGVLSQLKIWKIVQARKERKELEKTDEERQREEEEAELGRQVQEGQAQERREWERIYGEKKTKSSVFTTVIPDEEKLSSSISSREVDDDKTETPNTQTMPTTTATSPRTSIGSKKQRQIVIPVAVDDFTPASPNESQGQPSCAMGPSSTTATSVSSIEELDSKPRKKQAQEGPAVIPLPFTIPAKAVERRSEEYTSDLSVANTKHSSEYDLPVQSELPMARKISDRAKRFSVMTTTSLEAQLDDSASNGRRSPFLGDFVFECENSDQPVLKDPDMVVVTTAEVEDLPQETVDEPATQQQEVQAVEASGATESPSQHWPLQSEKRQSTESARHTTRLSQDSRIEEPNKPVVPAKTESQSPAEPSSPEQESFSESQEASQSAVTELQGPLQRVLSTDKPSRVVLQFRANEWAKHLESAEKPGPDPLTLSTATMEEPASIVNEKELLKTALTAEPAPAPIALREPEAAQSSKAVRISSTKKQRNSSARVPSLRVEKTTVDNPPDVLRSVSASGHLSSQRPSMRSESRRHSQRSPFPPFQASRNSLIASPIAEDVVASFLPTPSPSPSNLSGASNNPRRSSRRSLTDPSLHYTQSSSPSQVGLPTIVPGAEVAAALSNENLPLSKRKSYLRQSSSGTQSSVQTAYSSEAKSSKTPRATAHLNPVSSRQNTYPPADSHPQPQIPEHTLHRASLLAEWRRSKARGSSIQNTSSPPAAVANSIPTFQPPDQGPGPGLVTASNSNRGSIYGTGPSWGSFAPLGGTGLASNLNANANFSRGMVDSAVYSGKPDRSSRRASAMSAREVDHAHREVLRRMQAGANKALARDGK